MTGCGTVTVTAKSYPLDINCPFATKFVALGQYSFFRYTLLIVKHVADFVKSVNVTVLYLALPDQIIRTLLMRYRRATVLVKSYHPDRYCDYAASCCTWPTFPFLVHYCHWWTSGRLCEGCKRHCALSCLTRPYARLGDITENIYLIIEFKHLSYHHRFPDEHQIHIFQGQKTMLQKTMFKLTYTFLIETCSWAQSSPCPNTCPIHPLSL